MNETVFRNVSFINKVTLLVASSLTTYDYISLAFKNNYITFLVCYLTLRAFLYTIRQKF